MHDAVGEIVLTTRYMQRKERLFGGARYALDLAEHVTRRSRNIAWVSIRIIGLAELEREQQNLRQ